MKQSIFGIIAGSLLVATQLGAFPVPSSNEGEPVYSLQTHLGGGLVVTSGDFNGDQQDDKSFPFIEGETQASIPFGYGFTTQIDFEGFLAINDRTVGQNNLQCYYFITDHLTWRDTEHGLAGLFFGYGESNGGDQEEAQVWFVGPEGQFFYDDWIFYAQGGWMSANDEDENDVMTDAWWLRAMVRYFFSDRTCAQAEFGYASGEERNSNNDMDGFAWGGRVARTISDGPFSWFVEYFGYHIRNKDTPKQHLTGHNLEFGFELLFGGSHSKRDEYHRGIALDSPARLFGHFTGWTIDVLD